MVTGTTSPSTRYERISVSPASCSIKSEYVIASHAFKPQYKCINYTPAWEQRKLGELEKDATLYMGRGRVISAKDMSNTPGTFPVYSSSALDNGRMGAYGKYMFNQELITWSIDGGGAVFYRRKHRFSVTNVSGYIAVNPEKINCKFLAYAMSLAHSRIKFDYTVKAHPSVIRSLYTMGIPISLQEQQVIGSFFSRLDDLITLHQRKYDKLVVFKKSMLEKMFPKDGESVPEIRFAGFTDPWEQRKLGELEKDATLYMGRGRVISAKDMSNTPGTFPVYSSSALDNGRMGAYGKYMFNQELITWSIDGGGAVFYRRKHRFSVTNVSGYIAVNPEKINCKFLAYAMSLAHSRIKFDYTVKAHPSVIRSLYTMGIPISLQEQQVIGSFFSRLDDLITLHQRKYDKLVVFKKSMLEKMFPKDGESVPEIRFAGFTDPWEQRKLGELEKDATLYMGRGRVISAKDMSNTPGTFPVYSSSALDNGRMGAYGKYMFNQELITWSIDGGGAVFYRRKHRFSVTNVSGYIAVNPEKINCKFLAYAMSLAHSRIKFDYTVKAHPSVIRSLYTMGIPISLQEQQVIGSFFSRLDDLITLHQRKRQWLKWLDEGGEGTHHDIDILVFKFADDMKISVLCGVHACMTKSLGHTGNRYAGKQQQRGMGVP